MGLAPSENVLLDCLGQLATGCALADGDAEALRRQVTALIAREVMEGRTDSLETLLRRQVLAVRQEAQNTLDYLTDVRTLHGHDSMDQWALFAIPVCVFSGAMSLSTAARLDPGQDAVVRSALVSAGLAKKTSDLVLCDSLIPYHNLGRLRLAEQLMLISQVHGRRVPERLAITEIPLERGNCAPYMLLGVTANGPGLLSPIKAPCAYERRMHDALVSSFEAVPERTCSAGRPYLFSTAQRVIVGEFIALIVNTGMSLGGGPMTLAVTGLEDGASDDCSVRVLLEGHPLNFRQFVFHVPTPSRRFVLQYLRERLTGLPVTLRLPS